MSNEFMEPTNLNIVLMRGQTIIKYMFITTSYKTYFNVNNININTNVIWMTTQNRRATSAGSP